MGYTENGNQNFTICYCKQIAKNKKNEETVLQQQFSLMHKLMCVNPGQDCVPILDFRWKKFQPYSS